MTEIVQRREPPKPINGSPGQVARFVEKLKQTPNEFVVYSVNSNSRTAHSKAQQYKKRYPGSEWLVRSESNGYTLFGRWLQ